MIRKSMQTVILAAALCGVLHACSSNSALAAGPTDLFAQYYVGPPGVPAKLYVCPRPTPPLVGHTWITYQPLAPARNALPTSAHLPVLPTERRLHHHDRPLGPHLVLAVNQGLDRRPAAAASRYQ